ncbi:MAG: hypothetical protein QNJ72_08840 [Pleurocapsa sp. MO_226.B13]|nr:hypothetical protein [Pleurocapsa sp. MO_226.B13]
MIYKNNDTGFLGYIDRVAIDWNSIVSFTIAASAGTVLSAYLTKYIDAKQLQKDLAILFWQSPCLF